MSDFNSKMREGSDDMLEATRQQTNMTISPELFEQLYLSPKNKVKGELRQTVGNPTPIALGGFLLCTTPASMGLLEWRGAGGFGAAANVGVYFFFGGLMLLLGGIGEWILGNTFPATVFCLFSGFWFAFGATIVPDFNAYGAYSTTGVAADGLQQPQFFATFSFFLIGMAILCFVFMLAAVRTNIVFFLIFMFLIPTFGCLSGSFFAVAAGHASSAQTLQHAGAALLLVVTLLGWYIFMALVLLAVDFPVSLPLGDLSTIIKGKTSSQAKAPKESPSS
ncbi:hypothetical protein LIA77_05220 [Sarocladium implicatum]|nr:hypothetical protein LIA77_05220 [Sarocladium implicatum]